MKSILRSPLCAALLLLTVTLPLTAQMTFPSGELDPTKDVSSPQLVGKEQTALPEQYIWIAGQNTEAKHHKPVPLYFRASFTVNAVPQKATLYVAGPDASEAYLNGKRVDKVQRNLASPIAMFVFETDISGTLRSGKNVLALKIMPRGGDHHIFVAKIVPRGAGIDAPPLLVSDGSWKGSKTAASGWQDAAFQDGSWAPVKALGGIESSMEFFQGNEDAGLYRWPGYRGISSFLAHTTLPIASVDPIHLYAGRGSYENVDVLTQFSNLGASKDFTVHLPSNPVPDLEAPSMLVDFGKEISGRMKFVSDSDHPINITVAYGESPGEALHRPYLGIDPITIQPHGTAYGPKSAFRYAKIRFVGGGTTLRFQSIALDYIYYPVEYKGSFESSDPLLNKIWNVGAYTAHLCMQDDIWDATKRDRRRWAGDLDVSGRVVNDVFGDHFLMQDTMTNLLGPAPVKSHVNDITGYSAWWINELTQYYLHTGSLDYLKGLHEGLIQLLEVMNQEVNENNLFADRSHTWSFVDWSPELNGDTPEARRATQFEYYLAYRDAAFLLREMGDTAHAEQTEQRAAALKEASQKYLLDSSTNSFGTRWQTNAIAVFSGVANPSQYKSIWDHSLSTVGKKYTGLFMTPYYNYYIISAMAETGHRGKALDWIRTYWGGMVAEGATSFWEGYYPSWPKHDFHASLQADDGTGYFVSLAHGWSAGPTPWLMEQVLGIEPTAAGFSKVTIRPDLIDLKWAKGAEPTPHGLLKVDLRQDQGLQTVIDLPADEVATVLIPVEHSGQKVLVNGNAVDSKPVENGTRAAVTLHEAGHYTLQAQ